MDHNSGYVAAAYLITGGTLTVYATWLVVRLARARRSLSDDGD